MQDQVANKFIPSFLLALCIDWLKNYFETRNLKNKKLQIIFVNILFTRAKNLILKFKVVKDRFNRIFGKNFEETLVNCLVYDSLVLLIFLFNIKCSCLWSFVLVFCSFFNQNCISTFLLILITFFIIIGGFIFLNFRLKMTLKMRKLLKHNSSLIQINS